MPSFFKPAVIDCRENVEDHKKIIEDLKLGKTLHFSHDLPEHQVYTVILKGLDAIDEPQLKAELANLGFNQDHHTEAIALHKPGRIPDPLCKSHNQNQ